MLAVDSQGISDSVRRAMDTSLYVIIPALFPSVFFSVFVISSGIYSYIFRPLYFLFGRLFRLNERDFSVFLLSLVGGYPVGAKLLKDSANKHADLILCYCYCASPAFAASMGGAFLYGNIMTGIAIYLSSVISCITAAIIISRFLPPMQNAGKETKPMSLSFSLISQSVSSAAGTLALVCACVVAFSVFTELLSYSGAFSLLGAEISDIVLPVFEISNIAAANSYIPPYITAMLFSFGGLCTIFQTAAVSEKKIPLMKFLLARIPMAVLSGAVMLLFQPLFNDESAADVFAVNSYEADILFGNPVSFFSLVLMGVLLLNEIMIYNSQKNSKKG